LSVVHYFSIIKLNIKAEQKALSKIKKNKGKKINKPPHLVLLLLGKEIQGAYGK
jgi:hypothetical protein